MNNYSKKDFQNSEQLEFIYNKYYKLVFFVSLEYTHNEEISKDIVQEVFINYYEKVMRPNKQIKDVKAYLCSSSKNLSINEMKNREKISSDYHDDLFSFNDKKPTDNEKFVIIWNNSLNQNEKEIIGMHVFEEMTFNEISIDKNQSLNTVKSTYRRALQKLKKCLKEQNYEK